MTKEQELILRVFKAISYSYFYDYKMSVHYLTPVLFDRGLGDDIGNYVESNLPGHFENQERKAEKEKERRRQINEKSNG